MDLVSVTECQSDFDAKLLSNYLENNGIRTYISGGPASLAGLAAAVPFGAVVQVAKCDAERAAKLLTSREDGGDEPKTWTDRLWTRIARFLLGFLLFLLLAFFVHWLLGLN